MMKIGAAAIAAILVLGAAAAAAAQPLPTISTEGVNWSDSRQVAQIHHQIIVKSRDWCDSQFVEGVHDRRLKRECVDQSVAETLKLSGRPELVRLAGAAAP